MAWAHVIVCVDRDSIGGLRPALDAGADDAMRVPFEPEVLVARVTAGLTAARLRANDALLHSLVANIPGALYRCACDEDWTMEWLSDAIERISGYPASDFIDSAVRTFASVIHPEDRDHVERSVMEGVQARRPFTLEYRIMRRDGGVRWVVERGQLQEAEDGRRWLDGAIFDNTVRRAAEQALREREIAEAQLAEVRELSAAARRELGRVLSELRAGLTELRDLAHGLHPAVLSERGLEHALVSLANRASLPVELQIELRPQRLPAPIEAAAYFTVCEALTNVAKYAQATHAWVSVVGGTGHLDIEVRDDGVGGARLSAGSGLLGLRDRIAAVNGTLDIESRPGTGTVVRACVPVAA